MGSTWLTENFVRDNPLPESGTAIVYDAFDPEHPKRRWVSGFGVKFAAGGTRSFVLRYRAKLTRLERLYKIGQWPEWGVEAARREAQDLKVRIDRGEDPLAQIQAGRRRRPSRSCATNSWPITSPASGLRPGWTTPRSSRTSSSPRSAASRSPRSPPRSRELHRDVAKRAPYRANRVVAVASKMFSFAVKWKMRPDNPCRGIERNHEASASDIQAREMAGLVTALAGHRTPRRRISSGC